MRVTLYSQSYGSKEWTYETFCLVEQCFPDDPESAAQAEADLQAHGVAYVGGGAQPLFKLVRA